MRIMLLVQMTTIVIAIAAAAVMAILAVSIIAVSTTFAVTDNNTDTSTIGGGNDNSGVIARDGSSANGENAKSGINTTVCGPDAAHKCKTASTDGQ
jgi:CobQ-like glutamine amidotransferase family enzyme